MAKIKAGYKQTDIGVIPEDWDVAWLGSLGNFAKGSGIKKDEAQSGRIPCIRYGEIYTKHHDIIRGFYSFISEEVSKNSKKLTCGDILFACSGETKEEIGKCASFLDEGLVYAGGDIIILSPHSDDTEFLGYLLNLDTIVQQKASLGQGDAVVHINAKSLASILVALPKLKEQKAIAAALSDVDGLIESLENLVTKKRDMKTAAMQQLLTGKKRLPGFDGEWKEFQLGEFGKCLRGVSYSGATDLFASDNDDAAILLRSNNVKFARVNFSDIQFVKRERVSSEQYLSENDIVICMANGSKKLIGKSAFFADHKANNFTFGAFMGCFRTYQEKAIPKYIFYLLNSGYCRKQIDVLLAGSSINNLTPKSVESMEFKFPNRDEQAAISIILSDMDTEIDTIEQRLEKALSLKSGMMQELLTGKTRLIKTDKKQEVA